MRLIHLKQAGDTIVEVLISMAAVSMVLGAAFVTINQSVATGRTAQERVEALKEVEAQIESLKSLTKDETDPQGVFSNTSYCLVFNGSVLNRINTGTINGSIDLDDFSDPGGTYPPQCIKGFYHISITHNTANSNSTFIVRARWDSATGKGRDEVSILYRVYKGQ
jgi:type II secretory pathway pseudopilin PulG